MRKLAKVMVVAALTVAIPLTLGACGKATTQGGAIKIGTVGPDSYDPVLFQTIQSLQALKLAYTPLLTFKDVEGNAGGDVIPGLAASMPKISKDGKTYKLTLRKGLHYTDGAPIKASDFENTVKRLLFLGGPYSSFFTGIEGALAYQKAQKEKGDISGITSNDKTGQITIKLTQADTQLIYALAQQWDAPTDPAKSPFKSLTKNPPPGLGPYTLNVVDPSRSFILTKYKKFDLPGIAKGNIDKITGVVEDSVPRMTQDVINNKLDFMTEDPTGDLLPQVEAKYKDRFRLDPNPPNIYYFFMNETTPPFDNADVRKAVNYALDSRALIRIFGGRLRPTCNFLAPGMVGFKENKPCPYGDPNGPGNIAKAKQLVAKSGDKGMDVTVWSNNKDPRPAIADYYRDLLNQIGFKAKSKVIDQQIYFQTIGNAKAKTQTGFTDWFQDFPHPADFFANLISAHSIQPTDSFNVDRIDVPSITKKIDELKAQDPKKVADQWAALDKEIVDKGLVAPYGNEQASSFFSDRMNFKDCSGVHPVYKNDWSLFCLK